MSIATALTHAVKMARSVNGHVEVGEHGQRRVVFSQWRSRPPLQLLYYHARRGAARRAFISTTFSRLNSSIIIARIEKKTFLFILIIFYSIRDSFGTPCIRTLHFKPFSNLNIRCMSSSCVALAEIFNVMLSAAYALVQNTMSYLHDDKMSRTSFRF